MTATLLGLLPHCHCLEQPLFRLTHLLQFLLQNGGGGLTRSLADLSMNFTSISRNRADLRAIIPRSIADAEFTFDYFLISLIFADLWEVLLRQPSLADLSNSELFNFD